MASTESFLDSILQPGSSLNPTFLNILDGAFVTLFLVFVALAFVTAGNLHIFALMFIELGLWASVKWHVFYPLLYSFVQKITTLPRFVQELKHSQDEASNSGKKDQ
ncbi:hypothetical protein P691DRAFT_811488 [Macrolepiota fuliginosa MF-IS2]|uniref:Uncharacterized protein n=1 Tax=Macrolepiota fuliginosa MF-IS2 TaxID=1400762 RepID=A0A9P5XFA1_9AGAR|nr:hypothetical protein P691DRAFT_811488 [Macrolepiota fuliginosa MF-IS2]